MIPWDKAGWVEKAIQGVMKSQGHSLLAYFISPLSFRREQAMTIVQPACLDLAREEFDLPTLTQGQLAQVAR